MSRAIVCNKTRPDGFTLTDLLAVIVISGVLGLLLLPALASTKPNSQALQCLENQRQLVRAWQMYAQDNQGSLARNGNESTQPTSSTDTTSQYWSQWCGGSQSSSQAVNPAWIQAGCIYPYVKTVSVYRCPADVSTYPLTGVNLVKQPRTRSISMNAWIGPYQVWAPNYHVFYKESDLGAMGAANIWLLMDENPYSINDGYMIEDPAALLWIDYPAFYHNGGAGISFCDGHAQIKKWTDKSVLNLSTVNPTSQPPTPLNCPDLPWLQARSTVHL